MSTQRIVKHCGTALARVTCLTGKRWPKLTRSFYQASETVYNDKRTVKWGCQIFTYRINSHSMNHWIHWAPDLCSFWPCQKKHWSVGMYMEIHIKYTHAESDTEYFRSRICFLNGMPYNRVWGEVERFFSEIKRECSNVCHSTYKCRKLCWAGKCGKENPRTAKTQRFTDWAHCKCTRAPSVCWIC